MNNQSQSHINFEEDHHHHHHHDGNCCEEMPHVNSNKIGRNDLCFCGSGKKYKKCCIE